MKIEIVPGSVAGEWAATNGTETVRFNVPREWEALAQSGDDTSARAIEAAGAQALRRVTGRRIVKAPSRPLGVILHRGESPFTRAPFVVVAVLGRSSNSKTGDMIQVYILADDAAKPTETLKTGHDETVCGDCPLRGLLGRGRTCYVNLGQGPRMVHDALRRDRYPAYDPAAHDRFFRGRKIRWGAYGEPVLIPANIVAHLSAISAGWTGYTHQWARPEFAAYRRFFMASVHSVHDGARANAAGWRYFRASNDGTPAAGEIICPASAEGGWSRDCTTCNACKGAGNREPGQRLPVNVVIGTHGGFGTMHAARNNPTLGGLPIIE